MINDDLLEDRTLGGPGGEGADARALPSDRTMTDGSSFVQEGMETEYGPGPELSGEALELDMDSRGLEEMEQAEKSASEERAAKLQQLGAGLYRKFDENERKRQPIEDRWMEDLRQYHGRYDPGTLRLLEDSESCSLFLNITKPKTHAFSARVMDMVLPTDERNWGIEATPVPEVAGMTQSEAPTLNPDGSPMVDPGTNQPVKVADMAQALIDASRERAKAMEEEIDDQLSEARYNAVQRQAIEQMSKLGTGVIMGPIITDEWKTRWEPQKDSTGKVQYIRKQLPNDERRPGVQWVDVWNFYPDMSANDPTDWGFAFVQYLVNGATLRKMGKKYNFMEEQLEQALQGTPFNVRTLRWMNELRDLSEQNTFPDERYRLLRYYGEIDREDLELVGIDPDAIGVADNVFGSVWMVDNVVLKVDINPLDSGDLPFSVTYCDKEEASPFGTGIPRLMRGEQESVNGAWRMKHDNAGLSVAPQTVLKLNALTPADGNYQLSPRKVWYVGDETQRVSDVFGQFSVDSHQAELDNILQLAIRFADDVTQLPLLMQGDQAPHITQTAQGMSLLYNASTVVLRRTVKFYDDYVTVPLISRFYDWNMQFNPREAIKGDFKIIARGSSTLLDKEQQGQALDMAMQFASTPVWKPYTDMKKLYQMALKAKRIQDVILPDAKIEENMKADAEAAQAAAQAEAAPGRQGMTPEQMQIEKDKMSLKKYEVDSRERIAIANYATSQKISLEAAQAAIAGIRIKEDAANIRFNAELETKARMGTGI